MLSCRKVCALFVIVAKLPPALCHIQMSWPYPLRSKDNPDRDASTVDYNMMAPLEADGSDFPCKGYQNDRPIAPVITYAAGSMYNMTLEGSATHGGGSCQLSLSYDNGATFRVIKSMIGGCPLQTTYDFTIPPYAPAGNALLAWTWQNKIGNREFYMNCASVNIISGLRRKARRTQKYNTMGDLPFIWKANLEGLDTCETEAGIDPVYPNPGPDIEYGDGLSSSS
ncbi:lytic polysaccharide monooxygenase, partial [Polychaeton citri CBS 116435]